MFNIQFLQFIVCGLLSFDLFLLVVPLAFKVINLCEAWRLQQFSFHLRDLLIETLKPPLVFIHSIEVLLPIRLVSLKDLCLL